MNVINRLICFEFYKCSNISGITNDISEIIPDGKPQGFSYTDIKIPKGSNGNKGPSILINKSGLYLCHMSVYMNAAATSGNAGIRFIRMTDELQYQTLRLNHPSINGGSTISKTWVQQLNAGEQYGIGTYNLTNVDITLSGDSTVNYTSVFPLKLI